MPRLLPQFDGGNDGRLHRAIVHPALVFVCGAPYDRVREHSLDRQFAVLLSCVFGKVRPVELAEWLLDSEIQVRMQLQYHKYIWAPDARGV